MESATPAKRGWSANFGTTAVLLLESLRSPRIEHLRSITTPHEEWQKIQYYAENFVHLVVQGFIDLFFLLDLTCVSDIVIAGATRRSENMSEQAQGDLFQTQSQDDEQARGNLLPPELPWGKV